MTLEDLIDRLHRHANALECSRASPDPEARVRLVASNLRITANQLDRSGLANLPSDLVLIDSETA